MDEPAIHADLTVTEALRHFAAVLGTRPSDVDRVSAGTGLESSAGRGTRGRCRRTSCGRCGVQVTKVLPLEAERRHPPKAAARTVGAR